MPLGFAPFGLFVFPPLAVACLFYLLRDARLGQTFWRGWLFGVGLFGIGVSWVSESFQYNHIAWSIALCLTIAFVAFLSLFVAAALWTARCIRPLDHVSSLVLLLPATWLIGEWARGEFLTGFTWLQLGYSQVDSPLVGFAPVFGTLVVGWMVTMTSGLLVIAVGGFLARPRGARQWIALVGVVTVWGAGAALGKIEWTHPKGPPMSVALIQGNVSQDDKWKPEQRMPTLRRYVELTRAHWGTDLVIWPETAVPAFYAQAQRFLGGLAQEASASRTDLLVGIPVLRDDGPRNSVVHVKATPTFYDKAHLVPFGEYLPLASLLAPLTEAVGIPVPTFRHGATDQALFSVRGVKAAMMICYEVAFGDEVAARVPAADLLLNVSNDAWFGDSLAPHQHLQMARMRAIETGRFLARATNTGISALIDATGRITTRSDQFKTAVVTGEVRPMSGRTPYVRWVDWPALAVASLSLLAVIGTRRLLAPA